MKNMLQKVIKSLVLLGLIVMPVFAQANYYFYNAYPDTDDYFSVRVPKITTENSADLIAVTRWTKATPSRIEITFHYFIKLPIVYKQGTLSGGFGNFQTKEIDWHASCDEAIKNPGVYGTKSVGPVEVNGANIPLSSDRVNIETIQKITGLFSSTTYFYCASLTTEGKRFVTSPTSFSTKQTSSQTKTGGILKRTAGPDLIGGVDTYQASRTSDTEAIFAGYVERVSGQAYAYFRYAAMERPPIFCNDIYGSAQRSATATIPNPYGKISEAGGFSTVVRGLSADTTYYYCAVVSNSAINPTEIEYGEVRSFRTLPCQTCPQTYITTVRAYNISSAGATLSGKYRSIPEVEVYFEYKKDGDLEWSKTPIYNPPQKTYGNFWEPINGLEKSTVYQFRAVGEVTNVSKTATVLPTSKIFFGDTLTFKTTSGNLFGGGTWEEKPYVGPTGEETGGETPQGDGDCKDGIKNGDETGVDTGGRCPHIGTESKKKTCPPDCTIPPLPTCSDGIKNGNETGIDTGGWCGDGNNGDCKDGIKNGDETGVDTGGRCINTGNGDCKDGIQNGDETGVDTGGRCRTGGGKTITITSGSVTSGGTTTSTGGSTTISSGNTVTTGGTTTISGGTTTANGGATTVKNGTVTNVGGVATTNGGTTTIRGGTTTVKYKGPNGEDKECVSTGTVTVVHANKKTTVTCNNEVIIIKDGEGKVENVGGVVTTNNGNTVITGGRTTILDDSLGLRIGDRAVPPSDAIVRYHEGIETVFTRQIMRNLPFARLYGYEDGMDLQNFADTLSHTFAKEYFGYIDETGLEVRVARPDVSAYELRQVGGVLIVYEYYENIIIDIRNTTTVFKNKNPYEYYDRRRRN